MSDASKTLRKKYVGAYHGFWDYLEEHEEILQERNNVTLVCGIMEECPVVNFSCVRGLSLCMNGLSLLTTIPGKETFFQSVQVVICQSHNCLFVSRCGWNLEAA